MTGLNGNRFLSETVIILEECVSYSAAWALQSQLHSERLQGIRPDTILILEHEPVYTLGRGTQRSHWGGNEAFLRATGSDLCYVNRGGSVTYHGPGQIVVYPIFELAGYASGPRRFVWLIEETILHLLQRSHIQGHRVEKQPGIWVLCPEPAKIASIGIRVDHGVTMHGFSLNVDMDLTPFERIHPCGLENGRMTSMAEVTNSRLNVQDIKRELADIASEVFSVQSSTDSRCPLPCQA